ncbi:hypothetical protein BS17DRAFT_880098 [Gyrodon lividus]|nr:hypothetical protein BS17DRAFT_880098 [Gyrodon lividus]
MPLTHSILKFRRANGLPSRSPANPRAVRELYFPPGGRTYHRHVIPPDELRISLSDPVLVAAEEKLREILRPKEQKQGKESTTDLKQGSMETSVSRSKFETGRTVPIVLRVNSVNILRGTAGHLEGFTAIQSPIKRSSSSEHSKYTPNLAPLASETFKEELYVRGYLKRPASQSSTTAPYKPSASPIRGVSPQVLGRRRGQRAAEQLKALQNSTMLPGRNSSLSEMDLTAYFSCASLPTQSSADMESPEMQIIALASSTTFDLYEFSYVTAFTTPPSSTDLQTKQFEKVA